MNFGYIANQIIEDQSIKSKFQYGIEYKISRDNQRTIITWVRLQLEWFSYKYIDIILVQEPILCLLKDVADTWANTFR
jgi:hypothetical protein